ncbi:hypothetical protein BN970_00787 [Mycolicibacterium conceptionense]|uniref:Uncharacterized protein n=1 Tax=Mycolicibacterium conceptionense TaxID=451644 RepID=A0A0U1CYH2_9MYCO|nr:hypothetical protein BN970_00787 [Mycolicibacterium conceptionense]
MVAQQRRIGAPVAEHRLVRIARDDRQPHPGGQDPDQQGGLRIEVLCIVDQQQADPRAFGSQQVGVGPQCVQRRTDELGCPQCRHGGLRRGHTDCRPQQHDLLIGLRKTAGRQPFRAPGRAAEAL